MPRLKHQTRIYLRPEGTMALTWAVTGPAGGVHLQVELEPSTAFQGWALRKAFVGRHAHVRLEETDGERDDCDVLHEGEGRCYFAALDHYGADLWSRASPGSFLDTATDESLIWDGLAETYAEAFGVQARA